MTSFEFNDDGIKALEAEIQARVAAAEGKHPIPRDSSVEEIERIITAQLVDVGATPDVDAVKVKAAELHAALQDGSL